MWVEILNGRVILHSAEPEHPDGSIIFFQENIPQGPGALVYSEEEGRLILLNEDPPKPKTFERIVQEVTDTI